MACYGARADCRAMHTAGWAWGQGLMVIEPEMFAKMPGS